MNQYEKNRCTDATHDWAPSLYESGVMVCSWPGCGASAPANDAAPVAGVDVPAGARVVLESRRAA